MELGLKGRTWFGAMQSATEIAKLATNPPTPGVLGSASTYNLTVLTG